MGQTTGSASLHCTTLTSSSRFLASFHLPGLCPSLTALPSLSKADVPYSLALYPWHLSPLLKGSQPSVGLLKPSV